MTLSDLLSLDDEPPPIPPFNPQCSSSPDDPLQPQYEEVRSFALKPLTPGNHYQSGSEGKATFTVL